MLSLEKDTSPGTRSNPSAVQVRKSSSSSPMPSPSVSSESAMPTPNDPSIPRSASVSTQDQQREPTRPTDYKDTGSNLMRKGGRGGLAENGRSTSNLALSGSQLYLADGKESTPSIASDISNPYATQELQQRLQQLYKYLSKQLFFVGEWGTKRVFLHLKSHFTWNMSALLNIDSFIFFLRKIAGTELSPSDSRSFISRPFTFFSLSSNNAEMKV